MNLEVHLLSNDAEVGGMLEWSLRHYESFASRVVVHDGGPTMISSKAVDSRVGRSGVSYECRTWDTGGQLNDDLARNLKNECWPGTDADWVVVADMDELLHFPGGALATLARYEELRAAVPRPRGFEMFSDGWFEASDFPGQLLTDIVQHGAPDDEWYAKPVLFSPRRVRESRFGIGAHQSRPVLVDGRTLKVDGEWPFADPPCQLLHFKSIFGGLERIAERYDATRKRLSVVNVKHNWGNLKAGSEHAAEKRARLMPGVRRVIA